MSKIDLGTYGVAIGPAAGDRGGAAFLDAVAEIDAMGYDTIWLTGGPLAGLHQVADAVRATERARVATGILSVDRFPAQDVVALYEKLEEEHPGRFVLGLGGAHGPRPLPSLHAYLDRLDAAGVPAERRIMAALGPKMLDLARERSAGAFPVLVTAAHTTHARARLGGDTTLAVEQLVVLDTDAAAARAKARGPLGGLARLPAYRANFRRMGFSEEEIRDLADPLVDSLVCRGDDAAVADHVRAHLEAGADHVALSPVTDTPDVQPVAEWRRLATALGVGR
jgi:probable F420-dependent oxidoreductase